MELQGENLNLVKELLEDKIYSHDENIYYLKSEVEISPRNFKKALGKASNDRTKCLILLNEVLKSLEVQANVEEEEEDEDYNSEFDAASYT